AASTRSCGPRPSSIWPRRVVAPSLASPHPSTRTLHPWRCVMSHLSRRAFLAGATAAALLPTPSFAQTPKRGGTLRFIPIGDLKVLDPIWTTAYITRDHGYMIWDTLFAQDANFQIKPQMVDKYTQSKDGMKWSFTLREGLRFHDGQPVTSE